MNPKNNLPGNSCFSKDGRSAFSRFSPAGRLLFLFFLSLGLGLAASTIANVREKRADLLVIDKGRLDGVRPGMKGMVRGSVQGIDHINLGRFAVRKVEEQSSEVQVEEMGAGFSIQHISYLVFDEQLRPVPARTETRPDAGAEKSPPAKEETPVEKTEPQAGDPLSLGREKARRSWKNENGYWEAEFRDEIVMIFVPGGAFTIGSPGRDGEDDERPQHKAEISSFWIGKYETSFAQYDQFCADTGRGKADDSGWGRGKQPVINVSWHDAVAYAEWLSAKTSLRFRLPTEAEWEKAARERYPWGSQAPNRNLANFNNLFERTMPVNSFPQGISKYGLFNLAGNVWEWVSDWYAADYYRSAPLKDPRGPRSGTERVVRGGSWVSSAADIRSAKRGKAEPGEKRRHLGFRLAMDPS